MRLTSSLAPSPPGPSVLVRRLVGLGAGAVVVLVSSVGPVAAVEPPDVTRTVEATVHNIAVEDPGSPDGGLSVATAVEVDGELYDLPDDTAPALETGDVVELEVRSAPDVPLAEALDLVSAGQLDEAVVVSVEPVASAPQLATSTLEATGTHTLVMLPVFWSGTSQDASVATLTGLAQSTASYWTEQSGGRVSFQSVEAHGWTQVAAPASCSSQAMLDLYSAAVAAQGVAGPTDTRHVVVYFPKATMCGWAGMASVGGGMVWVNGTPISDVLAHEFGHNLGLGHANTYTCSSAGSRVALVVPTTACTPVEYHDYSDVMGIAMSNKPTGGLNTGLADQLGLARLTDIGALATGTVAIDLAPLGNVGSHRALRLPIAGGELYVDYRPAVGRDERWPAWTGVQVHLVLLDSRGIPNSYLLNLQPGAGDFVNASMPVGQAWAVPGVNVTLKVLSTGSTARVSVTSGTPPAGDAISSYVTRVYQDLFSRSVDPSGLRTWTSALRSGTPRIAVANAITYSTEYRSRLITASYNHYLGRGPDAAGLQNWLTMMAAGGTIQRMEAGFLASPEYYMRAGSTDPGWVRELYQHVLGRSAQTSEVNHWVQALRSGSTRSGVAMGFLLSTEHLTTVVDGYYVDLLGRHIDPSGRTTWVGKIQAGDRVEAIIGGIIASAEYYGRC